MNNDETALLSSKDNCAVFDFNEENRENKKLEEYFSDDEVVQAVIVLSNEEKEKSWQGQTWWVIFFILRNRVYQGGRICKKMKTQKNLLLEIKNIQ